MRDARFFISHSSFLIPIKLASTYRRYDHYLIPLTQGEVVGAVLCIDSDGQGTEFFKTGKLLGQYGFQGADGGAVRHFDLQGLPTNDVFGDAESEDVNFHK